MATVLAGLLVLPLQGAESGATGTKDKAAILVNPALLAKSHVLYSSQDTLPVGTVGMLTMTTEMKNGKLNFEMGQRAMNGQASMSGMKKDKFTVVRANRVEVEYEQDDMKNTFTLNGQNMAQPVVKGKLVGKTIVFVKHGDTWSGAFKDEDGEATEAQKKELAKKVKSLNDPEDAHILGKKPRKVGDTWDVDVSKLTSFGDGEVAPEGTYKVTFKSIENFEGHACALLVADVDITGTAENDMKIRLHGKVTVHQSLKHRIMLQNKADVTMVVTGKTPDDAGSIKIVGPAQIRMKSVLTTP